MLCDNWQSFIEWKLKTNCSEIDKVQYKNQDDKGLLEDKFHSFYFQYSKLATLYFIISKLNLTKQTHCSVYVLDLQYLGSRQDEIENAVSHWNDVIHLISRGQEDFYLEVFMIGPEVPEEDHLKVIQVSSQLTLKLFQEPFHDFKWRTTSIGTYKHPDLFIAFNSGVHCFLESWLPTLLAILHSNVPLCLTSHDQEDQEKQFQIFFMEIISKKMELLVEKSENPFFCYRVRPRTLSQMMLYNANYFIVKGIKGVHYEIKRKNGKTCISSNPRME